MDFFAWSKVIPLFLYPLPLFLLIVFGLSWAIRSAGPRWILRILCASLWIVSTPWFVDWAVKNWEVPRRTWAELAPHYDVAIVLGGLVNPLVSTPDHVEFGSAAERITEAVDLYRKGRVGALLMSSGSGELGRQDATEAPLLARWAHAQGVPSSAIIVEDHSRNTEENAVFSKKLVDEHGWKRVLLITSAEHMRRAAATFQKAGFAADGRVLELWPVDTRLSGHRLPYTVAPDPSSLAEAQSLLKEVVGTVVYATKGYLNLPTNP